MISSAHNNFSHTNNNLKEISDDNKVKLKRLKQNGQIQIYQSPYRGSYSSIVSDSIRNAALGRKVLLVQLMKGGVKQGLANAQKLCGNVNTVRTTRQRYNQVLRPILQTFPNNAH